MSCDVYLYLFFFPTLSPPRSTLFPYTTLFRSVVAGVHRPSEREKGPGARAVGSVRLPLVPFGGGELRDRKSTRLNSSHLVISYAVFCLKKKTEQIENIKDIKAQEYASAAELCS